MILSALHRNDAIFIQYIFVHAAFLVIAVQLTHTRNNAIRTSHQMTKYTYKLL